MYILDILISYIRSIMSPNKLTQNVRFLVPLHIVWMKPNSVIDQQFEAFVIFIEFRSWISGDRRKNFSATWTSWRNWKNMIKIVYRYLHHEMQLLCLFGHLFLLNFHYEYFTCCNVIVSFWFALGPVLLFRSDWSVVFFLQPTEYTDQWYDPVWSVGPE